MFPFIDREREGGRGRRRRKKRKGNKSPTRQPPHVKLPEK